MTDEQPAAPIVTISDPSHPGRLVDVLAGADPRPRITAVQAIATALVLLLGTATTAAVIQTRDRDRDQRQARAELARASFALEVVGVASDHRVSLVFSLGGSSAGRVVSAAVMGPGWRATPTSLRDGPAVRLTSAVTCRTALRPPTSARAVIDLRGQRRSIDLLTGDGVGELVGAAALEACGELPAGKALLARATPTRTVGDRLELDLTVTNRSVHDVSVTAVVVDGVSATIGARLPLIVPKRISGARFLLDDTPAEERRVHLTLRVAECLAIGQVQSRGYGQALVVQVVLTGVGGRAVVPVASAGLQQQVAALVRKRCGG